MYVGPQMGHAVGVTNVRVYDNGRVFMRVMNSSGLGGSRFKNFDKFFRLMTVTEF